MKYLIKIVLLILILYSFLIQGFRTVFEFFNKTKYSDYWLTIIRNDLPNLIATAVLVYVFIEIVRSFRVKRENV